MREVAGTIIKKVKDLESLNEGDVVRLKPLVAGQKKWTKGIVKKRLDERSYEVATDTGTFRRNRIHLRNRNELPSSPSVIVNPDNTGTTDKAIEPLLKHATNGSETQVECGNEVRHQQPIQPDPQRKSRINKGVKPAYLNDYVSK